MKILLAVDDEAAARPVIEHLSVHPGWLLASHAYTVMHVTPAVPRLAASMLDRPALQAYERQAREQAAEVFAPVRALFEMHGVNALFVSEVGPVAERIAARAHDGGFDLVLLGAPRPSFLRAWLPDSVAVRVLACCVTPVLLLR